MSDTPKQLWERTKDLAGGAMESAMESAKEGFDAAKKLGKRAAQGASEGAVAAGGRVAQLFDRTPAKPSPKRSPAAPRAKRSVKAAPKKGPKKAATRTTLRSSAGKKLYAVRDAQGQFKDIQTYERAHRADLSKKSKAELEADKKKATRKNK